MGFGGAWAGLSRASAMPQYSTFVRYVSMWLPGRENSKRGQLNSEAEALSTFMPRASCEHRRAGLPRGPRHHSTSWLVCPLRRRPNSYFRLFRQSYERATVAG